MLSCEFDTESKMHGRSAPWGLYGTRDGAAKRSEGTQAHQEAGESAQTPAPADQARGHQKAIPEGASAGYS